MKFRHVAARKSQSSLLVIAALATGPAAFGQTSVSTTLPTQNTASEPQADQGERGDIIVTARKKAENILRTPIAVSALTSADLTARGVLTLQDLTASIPGMSLHGEATAGSRVDRSFQTIIIRGILPASASAQTTSLFIDGVPVSSGTAIQAINDPQRVEVLKGPQSAYFGRQTFAGAVNVVNKLPTDRLSGSVTGMAGTRANYDIAGELSGPLFGDVLGFRISGQQFSKNGSYKNNSYPDQTLGDQKTTNGSVALVFKPTTNLTIKALGVYSILADGSAATGLIPAYSVKGSAGNTVLQSQSNCSFTGIRANGTTLNNAWFCGVAPKLAANLPSANITDSVIKSFLKNPTGLWSGSDRPDGYGLKNHYYHVHLVTDYKLGDTGITLSALTGWNREKKSELADLDNVGDTSQVLAGSTRGYFDYPYLIEGRSRDFSQELRASFENGGPLHLTLGASYLNALNQTAAGGSFGDLTAVRLYTSGATQAKTKGAFFGLGYDLSSRFSVNADGRYQIDHLFAYTPPTGLTLTTNAFAPPGVYTGGQLLAQNTFKNFMPRAIVQFNATSSNMFYASYSKGINPGAFNTIFLSQGAAVQNAAAALGYKIEVKPEKLDNFELGAKGNIFGHRLRYSIAAYYAIWKDQLNNQNVILAIPAATPGGIPGTAQLGLNINAGRVNLKGLEAELTAFVTPELTVNLNGAFTDSSIVKAVSATQTILTGITDFSSKENPQTSKYSAYIAAEYARPLGTKSNLIGFGRIDFTYKSGQWSSISNVVRSPDYTNVNLRAGIRNEHMSLEVFITNALNSKAYITIAEGNVQEPTLSHTTAFSALIAALPDLRTVGVRAKFNF
jgi:iron complex outermembrane receptor protein